MSRSKKEEAHGILDKLADAYVQWKDNTVKGSSVPVRSWQEKNNPGLAEQRAANKARTAANNKKRNGG